VHTLLKGLEKIAASADIPMLVAGDFNATPGSAAHAMLVRGAVQPNNPELSNDPLGILRPASKLQHQLPLASAYAAVAAAPDADHAMQRQKRRLDAATGEPKFTNIGRDFRGTLDYILYTTDSLVPAAALELPDESECRSKSNAGRRCCRPRCAGPPYRCSCFWLPIPPGIPLATPRSHACTPASPVTSPAQPQPPARAPQPSHYHTPA
jgi:hypothetical protein